MQELTEIVMVFLILANLWLLASSRLMVCIRIVACQGIVISLLPFLINRHLLLTEFLAVAGVTAALKGFVFPWLLRRAMREAKVHREIETSVPYSVSVLIGILILAISLWISSRLPMPAPELTELIVPVSFFTILVGLFVIVSRVMALSQVLGYLVFENGIYAFGVALLLEQPLWVELGILLDVFVAVFDMGIMIFHISREFDNINTDQLSELADWKSTEKEGRR